jgi:gliding motility-associated-like protein
MFNLIRHISAWLLVLFSTADVVAQVAMPDTVCMGTSRIYKVNDAVTPSTYTWKIDGITQTSTRNELSVTWSTPGIYQISVQEHAINGCDGDIRSGTVYVNTPLVPNAGPDTIVCFGSTVRLSGSGGIQYQWSPPTYLSNPGVSNPIVNIPVAGTYLFTLNVSGNGCGALLKDTVSVIILPEAKISAGNDTSIAINQPLQLNAIDKSNSGFVNYVWSPSFGLNNSLIKNPVASLSTISNGITFRITATTSNGCIDNDEITIKVFKSADIYVPTAFTPNHDGLNDFAVVIPVGIKELRYFRIFNRWGALVFETKDASKGWDGKYNGQGQDSFVFVWMAEGVDYNGNVISRKGTVTIIR